MSITKRYMEYAAEEERLGPKDKFVCYRCVNDDFLKNHIKENADEIACSYCERRYKKHSSISLRDLIALVRIGLNFDWSNLNNEGVSYDNEDGVYNTEVVDGYDIFLSTEGEELGDITEVENLRQDIYNTLGDQKQYVRRGWDVGDQTDHYRWGWELFVETILHRSRYVFLHDNGKPSSDDEIMPSRFLFELSDLIKKQIRETKLTTIVDNDVRIFRARQDSKYHSTAQQLGAPPNQYATQPNRMSPAGISMFYGAFDKTTTLLEVVNPRHKTDKKVSIGKFLPTRPLVFLDLSKLPEMPSIFDEDNHGKIHPLRFFYSFVRDLVKPIDNEQTKHIEYVPTQVITEFFRHIYTLKGGKKLDGMIYNSSRKRGKKACVIFCGSANARDEGEHPMDKHILVLKATSHMTARKCLSLMKQDD